MLARMEHKRKERGNQLKTQLQLRGEYLDVELRRRDQYMEETIRHRDLEWKRELEERDHMWRKELNKKEEAYWKGQKERDNSLVRMLERRYQGNHGILASRDQAWLNSLHHCSESLRLMTQEHINMRATMESIGKRQCEMTKVNT